MRFRLVAPPLAGLLLSALILVSCSSNPARVVFTSDEPGTAKMLLLSNLSAPGQDLGNLPATIPRDRLAGKAIVLSARGRSPQFWLVNSDPDQNMQFKVKFQPPLPTTDNTNQNRGYRFLMKAYQALSSNDFKMAKEFSAKLAELNPGLAAPYIVVGIAALEQGRMDEARAALNKARVLDPEDAEIVELLKRVR